MGDIKETLKEFCEIVELTGEARVMRNGDIAVTDLAITLGNGGEESRIIRLKGRLKIPADQFTATGLRAARSGKKRRGRRG